MNCTEAETRLPDFLADDLAPADRAALSAHLETCSACREAFTGLAELAGRLDRLPASEPGPALRENFYRMLSDASRTEPRTRRDWKPFAYAAAVLLLVGGGFMAGIASRGKTEEELPRNRNLVLLRQSDPGLRLAGIMLASQGDPADPLPAAALLDLLDRDPSESVRLAAVDALYLYGRQPWVRERLEAAKGRQTSPRVQVALADLLASLREQQAVEALKRLSQGPFAPVQPRAKSSL
jgi:hypothetical protein